MKKIPVVLIFLLTSLSLFAAEGFSSLEEQMSGKEFIATGLNKLSPAELDALNGWIRRHSVATLDTPKSVPAAAATAAATATTASANPTTAAAPETKDMRGLKSKDDEDYEPIVSRLIGSTRGWDGQTVFKLENGMIWAQADKDKHYLGKAVENQEVVIVQSMFGGWKLSFEGYNSKCKVVRIQ
jgi:hypothetical protein